MNQQVRMSQSGLEETESVFYKPRMKLKCKKLFFLVQTIDAPPHLPPYLSYCASFVLNSIHCIVLSIHLPLLCIVSSTSINIFQMHEIIFFFQKNKIIKKDICMPTLPKTFRPIIGNTLIFFIWPKDSLWYCIQI